jgi:mRNA-degrading endonuclease RelE of RelBE toxin-antitoxin system
MPYAIDIVDVARDELQAVRVFDRRRISQAIDAQLVHEPTKETKNRKPLGGVEPNFAHEPPVWELRVGEYRVYYDVRDESKRVFIRAVRRKPPHQTTEQII